MKIVKRCQGALGAFLDTMPECLEHCTKNWEIRWRESFAQEREAFDSE